MARKEIFTMQQVVYIKLLFHHIWKKVMMFWSINRYCIKRPVFFHIMTHFFFNVIGQQFAMQFDTMHHIKSVVTSALWESCSQGNFTAGTPQYKKVLALPTTESAWGWTNVATVDTTRLKLQLKDHVLDSWSSAIILSEKSSKLIETNLWVRPKPLSQHTPPPPCLMGSVTASCQ